MQLYLIDGIGPFFLDYKREQINWSKIPFENLEREGRFDWEKFERVRAAFDRFASKAASMGFNAITLDDLAHLSLSPIYSEELQQKLQDYRKAYKQLFEIASRNELQVFITTDVMFYSPAIEAEVERKVTRGTQFLYDTCEQVLNEFPEIQGVIFRIGESDAADVESDFPSQLLLRTPRDARHFLLKLLPLFERLNRKLIFRTWSVGIYDIGDLNWNRETFAKVFGDIDSPHLIISMKYGEGDFFRYLPLNKLFFFSKHQKIIEFQARREYEGFGEYPSFIGWEYQSYVMQLKDARNVVGCSVWCQTGGWSRFRKLTFLDNSSLWNELNTFVTIRIFREKWSAEYAIKVFYKEHFAGANWEKLLELLRLSDEAIRELIYIDDFSNRKIFFRRVRVPPVLWVYWDSIIVNHLMRKLVRVYVEEPEQVVNTGRFALDKVSQMAELAQELGLDSSDIDFQARTFEILSAAREYYLLPYSRERKERLEKLRDAYERDFPNGYQIELDFSRFHISSKVLSRLLALLLRDKRGYRFFDRVFTIHALRLLYPLLRWWEKRWVPEVARERAMGFETIFK